MPHAVQEASSQPGHWVSRALALVMAAPAARAPIQVSKASFDRFDMVSILRFGEAGMVRLRGSTACRSGRFEDVGRKNLAGARVLA
ncbi:hypothetical protein BRAO285_990002 [Bradyrhizobium sp. ORS 285]|nr:hypothetical protein BRAO285_990002 [Bradyrhizobium sp. ORS 285]